MSLGDPRGEWETPHRFSMLSPAGLRWETWFAKMTDYGRRLPRTTKSWTSWPKPLSKRVMVSVAVRSVT
jgi:hypothetical protein